MEFDIQGEIFLGSSHCGDVTTVATGKLELTDDEVAILVDLIKQKKND